MDAQEDLVPELLLPYAPQEAACVQALMQDVAASPLETLDAIR